MRDHFFDSQSFCRSLEKILISEMGISKLRLTSSAVANSNLKANKIFENRFRIKTRDLNDLVLLAIISWYMTEEDRILLHFEIQDRIKNNEDICFLELLLESKAQMLLFLQETQLWHTRDFFGNILNERKVKRLLSLVRPVYSSNRKPKKKAFRRGYNDKGTRRPYHEIHDLTDFSREQREIELKRRSLQDTILFLQGLVT